MKFLKLKSLIVVTGIIVSYIALSQTFSLTPIFGSVALNAGYLPDPHVVSVLAGGNVQASSASSSCSGYITDAPSYRLNYEAGSSTLSIYINADFDTTLLINTPTGTWVCDDDNANLDNLNSGWYFDNATSGQYDIWVGAYSESNNNRSAVLAISEYAESSWDRNLHNTTVVSSPQLSLSNGFAPDPYTLDVNAGGSSMAADLTSSSCNTGYFTALPSYVLNYSAGGLGLGVYIDSDIDTALAIRAPDGNWYCNDDHPEFGVDAGYYFSSPLSGAYNIYVGTYGESTIGTLVTLGITNSSVIFEPEPEPPYIYLTDGFAPDPYSIDVIAGGSWSATDLTAGSCATGYFTDLPNYILNYSAGASELGVYIDSDIDTALAIQAADGIWYCNDDFFGVDAGYYFNSPLSGDYDIYVGTYGESTVGTLVSLVITNAPENPVFDTPDIPDVPDIPDGEIQFDSKLL